MENDLSLEKIVQLVTREVIREMGRRGTVPLQTPAGPTAALDPTTSVRIDMRSYKTPIVTEHALNRLHERTVTVIIPAGAIITPRAKELMRERNISVVFE
jgi:hypothetical protein